MTLLVVEVAQIIPNTGTNSANSLTIPLTFFDLPWLVVPPPKGVLFYRITGLTSEHFHSFILPKLKLSLSLALGSYLPLSGCLTYDQNDLKPRIVVSQNDAILVTIAETDADFSHLSGYCQRQVSELKALTPELSFSDDSASAFSVQITLFPNQGFSIGYTAHHAVLDGNSLSTFMKAWAHLCKQDMENRSIYLPKSLTPSLDRSFVKDVTRVDEQMIELVRSVRDEKSKMTQNPTGEMGDDKVLATLVMSDDDVERLRERCRSRDDGSLSNFSTFAIVCAYMWTCFVKARGGKRDRPVSFFFGADFRTRLDPPLPATYFGNCVFRVGCYNRKAADIAGERGFVTAVEIISDLVKSLSSPRMVEMTAQGFANAYQSKRESSQFGYVIGSNRFRVYEMDFGWGRPVKVDFVQIGGEGISLTERRDQSGGAEMEICMKKTEMDLVLSFFRNGLQNY